MNMIRQAEQEKGNFDTSGNSHVELINCFENLFWWFNHRHRFLPRTVAISWSHFEIKLGEWQQNDVILLSDLYWKGTKIYISNILVKPRNSTVNEVNVQQWMNSTSKTKKCIKLYFLLFVQKRTQNIAL